MYKEATSKTYTNDANLSPYGSLSTIAKIIGEGNRILDVGCASGYLQKYAPNNEFFGIDGNSDAVNEASKVYKNAIVMDLNSIPTKKVFEDSFDFIVFADILEHLLYPTELLGHFRQYLKPNGKVIVSLPNIAIWRSRLNLLFGKFDYTDYGVMDRTHVHLYTLKSSRLLLEEAGYKVTSQQGAAYATGPIVNLNNLFKSLFSVHIIVVAE